MKILVVGSLNYDYTFLVDRLPQPGETILSNDFKTSFGGKGANQAVACSRLGGDVCMIGAIGNDEIGKEMIANLKNNGIDIRGIRKLDGPSGMAVISVDKKGENSIVVNPGVNAMLTREHIKESEELIKECDIIVTQLEIPMDTVEEVVELAEKWNKKVVLNPAPAMEIREEVLRKIYLITPNETEVKKLTGEVDVHQGGKKLLQMGIDRVIVTMGSNGALFIDDTLEKKYNAYKVEAVDPTAAGDTFNGALAVKMDGSIDEAIEYAGIAAALATTKVGAQTAIPFSRDVEIFLG